MKSGLFIAIEGSEGAGKSTNLKALADRFTDEGYPVLITREPGGTPLGETLRHVLLNSKDMRIGDLAEILMMFAARAQHIEDVIMPALADGSIVITDRFTSSTRAYQNYARGLPMSITDSLENIVQDDLRPDYTIYFDCPPEIGLQRVQDNRGGKDRIESEDLSFFEKVRRGFIKQSENDSSWIVVDASQELEDVTKATLEVADRIMTETPLSTLSPSHNGPSIK